MFSRDVSLSFPFSLALAAALLAFACDARSLSDQAAKAPDAPPNMSPDGPQNATDSMPEPPPVVEAVDTDADGVPDAMDNCTKTPPDTLVQCGCYSGGDFTTQTEPLDADFDAWLDQVTAPGHDADFDGDGIMDSMDACDTSHRAAVHGQLRCGCAPSGDTLDNARLNPATEEPRQDGDGGSKLSGQPLAGQALPDEAELLRRIAARTE